MPVISRDNALVALSNLTQYSWCTGRSSSYNTASQPRTIEAHRQVTHQLLLACVDKSLNASCFRFCGVCHHCILQHLNLPCTFIHLTQPGQSTGAARQGGGALTLDPDWSMNDW